MTRQRPINQTQLAWLRFIADFKSRDEVSPTIMELCGHFGLSSANAAVEMLNRIEAKGLIYRVRHRARDIRITDEGRAVLAGAVA